MAETGKEQIERIKAEGKKQYVEEVRPIVQARKGTSSSSSSDSSSASDNKKKTLNEKRQEKQNSKSKSMSDSQKEEVEATGQDAAAKAALKAFEEKSRKEAESRTQEQQEEANKEYLRLRKNRKDAEKRLKKAQNARTLERDMVELDSWSDEDKEALEAVYTLTNMQGASQNYIRDSFTNLRRQEIALQEKYGKEKVAQMLESLTWQKNAQETQKAIAKGQADAEAGWFGASAKAVGASVASGLTGIPNLINDLSIRTGRYKTLDPNTAGNIGNAYSGAVQGQVLQNIDENFDGKLETLLSLTYQGGMATADIGATAIAGLGNPAAIATIYASRSATTTIAEASARGASPGQALTLGAVTAGIEWATEKIPLDNLLDIAKGGKGAIVKTLAAQGFSEAVSEEISLALTTIADEVIMGEKSASKTEIAELVANGMSYEEAQSQVNAQLWDEAVNTFLVSAIAGAASAGGAEIVGAVDRQIQGGTDAQQQVQPEVQQAPQTPEAQQPQIDPNQTAMPGFEQPVQTQQAPQQEQPAAQQKTLDDLIWENMPDPNAPRRTESFTPEAVQKGMDALFQQNNLENVKGTGAAERNFSQKPTYNAVLSEDNSQEDRGDDARPMELPKQDANGGNVSAVTGNVYGSRITPDDFASLMEEPTAKGDFSYVKITNDQATQKAQETIAAAGTWENAYDSWKQSVSNGNAGAEMSARGAIFLDRAAKQGNKQAWLETLHYMQQLGTNTAQGLQAMRIIRTLKPVDKIEFVRMSVEKMATGIKEKYGVDLEIDQNLIEKYEKANTDEERDAVIGDIQQNIADQIPSTVLDKWTALRYTNMLGNLKTNVRNIAGNVGSAAVYRTKDTIAAGIETIASKVTGGNTERTKSLFVNKSLLNACKEDFQQVKEVINSGGKYADRMSASGQFEQGVQDKRTIFKGILTPLEYYRKGTNWMMNNKYFGDEAFGRVAYSRALAGYLQANGVTDSDLSKADGTLLNKARAYAIKEAQEATFHDNSALAQIVSKLQKDTGVVGQGLVPFTKTPANVLTRAEEFSPLGLINSTVKSIQAATGNENVSGADVINSWAKTITGVGLFALGAAMFDQGLLTGGPDDDEDKAAFDEMNGHQDYAIQLPDGTNYTIDWLTPLAMPMFMGAQFWKILSSDNDLTFADLEQVFTSIADPLIQMSMLQGLNDSLDSIKYSDNNLGQFFINAAVNYLTQGLSNTLLGQIERSFEKNRQTTYVDKDSSVPAWLQRQIGSVSQKIPGWDYQQTDYRNAWGQAEENEGGLLYNTLSPGYINKEQGDQITQELYRLQEATGEDVFPGTAAKTVYSIGTDGSPVTRNMSEEEYQTYAEVQGTSARKGLEKLFNSEEYQNMSDSEKIKAINNVYNDAIDAARASVTDYSGFDNEVVEELQRLNAETGVGGVFHEDFESTITYVDNNGDEQSRTLSPEEYATLRDAERAESATLLKELVDNPAYKNLSDNLKAEAVQKIYKYAGEKAKQKAIADYHDNTESWMQKLGSGKTRNVTEIMNQVTYSAIDSAVKDLFESHKEGFAVSNQDYADLDEVYQIYKSMSPVARENVLKYADGNTAKYLEIRDKGVNQKAYMTVVKSLATAKGTGSVNEDTGKPTVRDIDKREAIGDLKSQGLNDGTIDIIMKAYMSDEGTTELKYDAIRDMGYDAAGYADVYRAYLDNDYKRQKIAAIMEAGNCDYGTANRIYRLFAGRYKPWE